MVRDVLLLFQFIVLVFGMHFFLHLWMLFYSDEQFIWEMLLFMLKIVILKMLTVTMSASSSVKLLLSF